MAKINDSLLRGPSKCYSSESDGLTFDKVEWKGTQLLLLDKQVIKICVECGVIAGIFSQALPSG